MSCSGRLGLADWSLNRRSLEPGFEKKFHSHEKVVKAIRMMSASALLYCIKNVIYAEKYPRKLPADLIKIYNHTAI